jgi:hypothetical protein
MRLEDDYRSASTKEDHSFGLLAHSTMMLMRLHK